MHYASVVAFSLSALAAAAPFGIVNSTKSAVPSIPHKNESRIRPTGSALKPVHSLESLAYGSLKPAYATQGLSKPLNLTGTVLNISATPSVGLNIPVRRAAVTGTVPQRVGTSVQQTGDVKKPPFTAHRFNATSARQLATGTAPIPTGTAASSTITTSSANLLEELGSILRRDHNGTEASSSGDTAPNRPSLPWASIQPFAFISDGGVDGVAPPTGSISDPVGQPTPPTTFTTAASTASIAKHASYTLSISDSFGVSASESATIASSTSASDPASSSTASTTSSPSISSSTSSSATSSGEGLFDALSLRAVPTA